jgi:hypothetical protein
VPICLEDVQEYVELPELEPERPAEVYAGQGDVLGYEEANGVVNLLSLMWREPNRHLLALSLAGVMAKEGYLQEIAEAVVIGICQTTDDTEVRDRLIAVRDTYRAAALGQPVKAWKALAELMPPDTLDYFRELIDAKPKAPPPGRDPPEDDDPYEMPFRLTDRQDFPSYPALMQGILPADPRGVVGYLAGLSQSFKSYLSLDWGCHVSQGMAWHGHEVTQAQVLYVCAEGQYSDLISRLRAWEAHHGVRAENLFCRLSPINLFVPESVEKALRLVSRIDGLAPRLVILDTLSQCAGEMQETSNDDARTIYRACKRWGTEFGATVLVVHHAGKSEGAILRGASALFDDSDFVHQLVRPGWQVNGMDCTLNSIKLKSARRVRGHEMQAKVVEWAEGNERGSDLVLVQRVLQSAFSGVPSY